MMKLGGKIIFETLKTIVTTILNKIYIWGLKRGYFTCRIHHRNVSVFSGFTAFGEIIFYHKGLMLVQTDDFIDKP